MTLTDSSGNPISSKPEVKLELGMFQLTNSQFIIGKYSFVDIEDIVCAGDIEIHRPFIVHMQRASETSMQLGFIPFGEIPGLFKGPEKFVLTRDQYWYVRAVPANLEKEYLAASSGIALA